MKKVFSDNRTYRTSILEECIEWLRSEYKMDDLEFRCNGSDYINGNFTIVVEIIDEEESKFNSRKNELCR